MQREFELDGRNYILTVAKMGQTEESQILEFTWEGSLTFSEVLDIVGLVPIPPYLNREATSGDKQTYQTVYSQQEGSVAAPTAGLHFTSRVLGDLKNKGIDFAEVTLHVGAGNVQGLSKTKIWSPFHAYRIFYG